MENAADFHPLSRIANAPSLDFVVPWSVVVLTVFDQEEDEPWLGSGSLITGKAVLTAAHNICDNHERAPKDVSGNQFCVVWCGEAIQLTMDYPVPN